MKVKRIFFEQLTVHMSLWRWPWHFRSQRQHKPSSSCNDLVSTADLLQNAQITKYRQLGTLSVPIKQIIGSGRWRDFDLSFQPRKRDLDGRWRRLAKAWKRGVPFKPVRLLKIGGRYFVVDGNHRISVAQASGQQEIAAEVMALDVENGRPEPKCQRLGFRIIPQTENSSSNTAPENC
jgi:hypothetical protein